MDAADSTEVVPPVLCRARRPAEQGGTSWSHLDGDTLSAIACCLPNARDVAALACTCRDARRAARGNAVWGPLLGRDFGLHVQAPETAPLAAVFRQLHSAWRRGGRSGDGGAGSEGGGAGSGDGSAGLGAVPFEGLYTDGGMDEGEPSFWVANLFDPSGWAVYCSQSGANVHCIALLKAAGPADPFACAHRSALISLASDVAWVLFLTRLPPRLLDRLRTRAVVPLHERLRAAMAASLGHWSTHGLERLLLTLVNWYRFMRHLAAEQEQEEAAAKAAAAAAAAAEAEGAEEELGAGPEAGPPPRAAKKQRAGQGHQAGQAAGSGAGAAAVPPPPPPAAPVPGALAPAPALNAIGNGGVAAAFAAFAFDADLAAATPLPPSLAAVIDTIESGRSRSGRRALVWRTAGGDEQRELHGLGGLALNGGGEAAAGEPGGAEEGELMEVFDRRAGDYLASPSLEHSTAIIDGITVSRAGEFTCPVACGAIFLGHLSPAPHLRRSGKGAQAGDGNAAAASSAANGHGSSAEGGAELGAEDSDGRQEPVRRAFADLVRHRYVAALSGLTDLAAVEAAAAAGLLPPLAARRSCPHAGEWVEFQRPPPPPSATAADPGAAAAAKGASSSGAGQQQSLRNTGPAVPGHGGAGPSHGSCGATAPESEHVLWPVVWFRFFPHRGLGDEGDQEMALPPVLPQVQPHAAAGGGGGGGEGAGGADGGGADAADGGDGQDGSSSDSDDDDRMQVSGDYSGSGGSSSSSGGDESGGEDEEDTSDESASITLNTSSDSSGSDDEDEGGEDDDEEDVGAVLAGSSDEDAESDSDDLEMNLEDWQDELDFLYGTEGQALPPPYDADGDAHQHWYDMRGAEMADADADAAGGGAAGGSGGPSGSAATADARGQGQHGRDRPRKQRREGHGAGPIGSGGGTRDGSGSGGGAGGGGAGFNGNGALLTGLTPGHWVATMAQPNVAGAVLALVSEAVGVQALRHTYQIVHTALQSELPPPPRHARHGAAGRRGGGGWHTATGLPHGSHGHGSGGAAQGAAGPTATANGAGSGNGGRGRPARPLGRNGSASDRAAAAAAAEPEAPLAVLLPVETSTRAFEGMPDAPAPQPQAAAEAAAASAAPVADAAAGAGAAQPPSGHLCMPLIQRWAGNAVLVKLIAPEDRTGEFGDDEEDATLNIDAQFVALRGVALSLRPPLRL